MAAGRRCRASLMPLLSRAGAGLHVKEATKILQRSRVCPDRHPHEATRGWRRVQDAMHEMTSGPDLPTASHLRPLPFITSTRRTAPVARRDPAPRPNVYVIGRWGRDGPGGPPRALERTEISAGRRRLPTRRRLRCKRFDGVEVTAAMAILIDQFLAPTTNRAYDRLARPETGSLSGRSHPSVAAEVGTSR